MLLQSPQNLHYPITVTELLRDTNDKVGRNETLFSYTYKSTVIEGNKYGEEKRVEKTLTTKLESEVEGTILKWKVKPGAVIDKAGFVMPILPAEPRVFADDANKNRDRGD